MEGIGRIYLSLIMIPDDNHRENEKQKNRQQTFHLKMYTPGALENFFGCFGKPQGIRGQ